MANKMNQSYQNEQPCDLNFLNAHPDLMRYVSQKLKQYSRLKISR